MKIKCFSNCFVYSLIKENEKTIKKIKEFLQAINDYERGYYTKEEFF